MKKEIKWGVVLSFISQAISILVGLAYSPVMIRALGQNEYGLYQLVQSVVNYLNLMNFGFSGAYIRFYARAKAKGSDEEVANVNGMFARIFLFISLLVLVAGAVLLVHIRILGDQLTEADYGIARQLMMIMVLNLAISFPGNVFSAYILANERFVFHKTLAIVFNLLVPVFNLPILWLGYGSVGIVAVSLLLSIIRLGFNVWYCFRKLQMKINIHYSDRAVMMELFGYTFFIFLSDIVDQLNTNVDKFLLGRMIGTVSVAIYSVGFNLRNYYLIASWVIPELYIPEVHRIAEQEKEKRDQKLSDLFIRIGRYNNFLCLLILTGFILFGRSFILLWVGEGYTNSYYVCLILMLAGYIPSIQTLGVNIQDAKNSHRTRSVVYFVIACCNVGISILLIRKWGEIGTALGTLVAVLLGSGIFMNVYYHKHIGLNIPLFWKETGRWTTLSCVLCVVSWFVLRIIPLGNWLSLLTGMLCYVVLYLLLLWTVGLKAKERMDVSSWIREGINRVKSRQGA